VQFLFIIAGKLRAILTLPIAVVSVLECRRSLLRHGMPVITRAAADACAFAATSLTLLLAPTPSAATIRPLAFWYISLAVTGMPTNPRLTPARPRPRAPETAKKRPRSSASTTGVHVLDPIVGCFAIVHVLLTIIDVVLVPGTDVLMTPMRVIGRRHCHLLPPLSTHTHAKPVCSARQLACTTSSQGRKLIVIFRNVGLVQINRVSTNKALFGIDHIKNEEGCLSLQ
jgi:hypothetical protein